MSNPSGSPASSSHSDDDKQQLATSREQGSVQGIADVGEKGSVATTCSENNNNQAETTGVRVGRCKWFNVAKGWGFITPRDGGQDVFVHQTAIQMPGFRSLAETEEVEFECKNTERGVEATRVSAYGGADCSGSELRPRTNKRIRRVRCYNCGEFANHIASKCNRGPQPKRCHRCKDENHVFADCPRRKAKPTDGDKSNGEDETKEEAGETTGNNDDNGAVVRGDDLT